MSLFEGVLIERFFHCIFVQSSSEVDLSDIGLMSLYSEVHPTVSYIIHYGINMIAPVYKLQVVVVMLGRGRGGREVG